MNRCLLAYDETVCVLQVDTHVHAASCMNQKHLLRFMKRKVKTSEGEKVCELDGEKRSLPQVRRSSLPDNEPIVFLFCEFYLLKEASLLDPKLHALFFVIRWHTCCDVPALDKHSVYLGCMSAENSLVSRREEDESESKSTLCSDTCAGYVQHTDRHVSPWK